MPRERVKSVAATAAMACLAVAVAYALLGTVAAALVALALYGVAVFMLGLVNAGAAAAALMATLAVVRGHRPRAGRLRRAGPARACAAARGAYVAGRVG